MRRKDCGFTIVELVIIMAVIAVLAAVLIPALSNLIAKANYNKILTDCTNALKKYRVTNPNGAIAARNRQYKDAYFIFKRNGKVYYFRAEIDENIAEIDESELPDFTACAYADIYKTNPADMSESERTSEIINFYRIDNLTDRTSIYYIVTPFDENGMSTILETVDFTARYYYLEDEYYTTAALSEIKLNEERAPHFVPDTDYIEDYLGLRYIAKADGTSEIAGYVGTSKTVEIPQFSPDNRRVTSVGAYAFESNKAIESVVLPEGLKTVEPRGFYQCSSLKSVVFPQTLKTLNSASFYGCAVLSNVVLPQSLEKIDRMAFCGCRKLTGVSIPVNTTLEAGCFGGVKNVTFEGENPHETAKYRIVSNCIIEKSSGTVIAGNENSVVPDDGTVKIIGRNSFSYIRNTFDLYLPSSVTKIDDNAFYGSKIRDLTGGEGLKTIGTSAFTDSGLTSFTVGPEIKIADSAVFTGCRNLVLTIENGVEINSVASGVKTLILRDDNPKYKKSGSAIVRIADNVIVASERGFAFPDDPGEYTVAKSAFCACNTPEELIVPENVKSIGHNSFSQTTSEYVRVTAKTTIEPSSYVFSFCYYLETAVIESPITTLGDRFFAFDYALKTVYLPKTLTKIAQSAFSKCSKLTDIYFAGTREEWNGDMPSYTVHCTDGDLSLIK